MTTLYLDMDGVVADFDEYANRTLGVPPSEGIYPDHVWRQLAANPRIYRDLRKTPYADHLVDVCRALSEVKGWELKFLTAVPKGNDVAWAFHDKMAWALFHYPDIPVMFGPYSKDKHQHCRVGDILIDDRSSNIDEWCAAGGIGILHKTIEETIRGLSTYPASINWGG